MKFLKLLFILILVLNFTACNKKDKEEKNSLPKPQWEWKISQFENNGGVIYQNADHDPASATKIGFAYSQELKDYEKAIEWYKYSNSMKPSGANSNYACYAYQQLKQFDEAISWCKQAIELGEDEALFQLGSTYYKDGDFRNSLLYFQKSYEKGDKQALTNIALNYQKLGDFKEAEKWYKIAIQNNILDSYNNIANLYHENLKDDIKASAYSLALINTKYTATSVVNILVNEWKIPVKTIKQGYDLQLSSPDFPIKFEGRLSIFENEKSK